MTVDGWSLGAGLSRAGHNEEEAQEIAETLGDQCPSALLSKPYGVRFEIDSDPDPELDYFNYYEGVS